MISLVRRYIIPAAYEVLPPEMCSPNATAMLVAIGYQESLFEHRRQIKGPARGLFQFEEGGGVRGVLTHPASRGPLSAALKALLYRDPPTPNGLYRAIEHNDVLAVVLARLLLWTLPQALPTREQQHAAWDQYVEAWRPGAVKEGGQRAIDAKAHWPKSWAKGWETL